MPTKAMLTINEIFHSIQGESTHTGRPCVFVRLTACDLRCSWCDTPYAFTEGHQDERGRMSVARVRRSAARLVEITGGEPLLQPDVYPLMERLLESGHTVMVETGGHLSIEQVPASVIRIVDVKCPGSGESAKNHWENLALLTPHDEVKFVIRDRADYEYARDVVARHGLAGRCAAVLFSPVHGVLDARDLAAWILDDRLAVRLQLQAHKFIWGATTRRREACTRTTEIAVKRQKAATVESGSLCSAAGWTPTPRARWRARDGYELYALTVRYGQVHAREIDAARDVARILASSGTSSSTSNLAAFGGSALVGDGEIPEGPRARRAPGSRPPTCRRATRSSCRSRSAGPKWSAPDAIVLGVNALDYSGYPDCRPEYLEAFERVAALATKAGVEGRPLKIMAPLLRLSKADIVRQGIALGLDYGLTHSCYDPAPSGLPCGRCDSCRIRARGFDEAGVDDPVRLGGRS